MVAMCNKKPLYGELIEMLNEAKSEAESPTEVSHLLVQKFSDLYQHIVIGRPERFCDTVCRIAAPTKSSLRGAAKLIGSPLVSYKRREWMPKIRNKGKLLWLLLPLLLCKTCLLWLLL